MIDSLPLKLILCGFLVLFGTGHLCIVLLIKHRAKQLWGSLNKHKASLVVLLLESKAVLSCSSSSEGKLSGS